MKTASILSLALLSGLAAPAIASEPFRPWLQAHWEVDEGSGLPTPAMAFGSFRPWQQAHWEVADKPASTAAGLAAGDIAGR